MPIENEQNLRNFEMFTKLHALSLHVWFVIFWGPMKRALHNFCEKPDKNRFHLNFDTLLLVKCYNNSHIHEWYTVNNNKEVQMTDLMEWQPGSNLVIKSYQNLYRRRHDVAGSLLRVSSVKEHPTSLVHRMNGENHTMFTKIIIELASHMNFTLNFSWIDDFYGIWNETESKWTGILGRLQSQQIDLAASEMIMTKERVANFDFTCPLILTRAKLFIKQPRPSEVQWKTYLKAFDHKTWISLIILIILSGTIVTYMKIKISKVDCLKNYLVENYLYIWGIYCQQGLSEFPCPSSLRIAFMSIICSGIVFSALYSACITSYLAIFTPNVPFRSLPKYTKDGTYKLIVLRNSAEHEMFRISQDFILKKMNKFMKEEKDLPINDVDAFEQICQERVALYSNSAMKNKVDNFIPCKLYGVKTVF
ncbi:PREDICTED: glutamate receptor U1-like [Ceratosolen solmsi marchali]|uniref:Glutamate receptor U1-like n=1 Tax=Ceratosolen solmsi marchali TaxID=326594 RepID=A0AAJ6YMR2_9HYME|nr:PREDICTED: glutamate receptor U1-like [Ceratosolen solmsi marchali]